MANMSGSSSSDRSPRLSSRLASLIEELQAMSENPASNKKLVREALKNAAKLRRHPKPDVDPVEFACKLLRKLRKTQKSRRRFQNQLRRSKKTLRRTRERLNASQEELHEAQYYMDIGDWASHLCNTVKGKSKRAIHDQQMRTAKGLRLADPTLT